jgi:hypothetical protein
VIETLVVVAAGPEFERKDAKLAKERKGAEPEFTRRARRFGTWAEINTKKDRAA